MKVIFRLDKLLRKKPDTKFQRELYFSLLLENITKSEYFCSFAEPNSVEGEVLTLIILTVNLDRNGTEPL